MYLDSPVIEIKNIGEQRVKKLQYLGIETVGRLIEHFPREYDDRSNIKKINELELNDSNTFIARISGAGETIRIHNKIVTRIRLWDDTGAITGVWYNQPYMKTAFLEKQEYVFTGKVQKKYGRLEVSSPEFEKITQGEMISGGHIIPIYPSTAGLSQKLIRAWIKSILEEISNQIIDVIPVWMKKENQLCDRNFAIQNIHFPKDRESFFIARKRLVFEELFLLQMALLKIKSSLFCNKQGLCMPENGLCEVLIEKLPFALTNAQSRVFEEIKKDMASGKVMNRLIQGDVGSGKTVLAMLCSFLAIKKGYQAVIMAPTEVLAKQHYDYFQSVFLKEGIQTALLTGSLTKKEKTGVLDDICSGAAKMIVATHAVIQKTVVFQRLGIVITDEQHRFGVRQRGLLTQKGDAPHVLVMTATPIPRTLALILYGDLDISIIDELPPGRQAIDTQAVTSSYHERIYQFMKNQMAQGRQCYVICPMIEENEKLEVQAVTKYTQELKEEIFTEYEVACLHGKMKASEKQCIMDAFIKKEIQVLVSTTVIEVGINVPNATIILIENAERFGLAQLHQLRGRVGRGKWQSYCILVSDAKNQVAKARMRIMKESADGFYLSEMDLKLRGPGEFFGTKQHGLPELKISNLYKDMALLQSAQKAAAKLIKIDYELKKEEHQYLKQEMERLLFQETIPM